MLDFPRWKRIYLWGLTALCLLAALPSLLTFTTVHWPDGVYKPVVNLGLDLAGGSHILLEADASQLAVQRLDNLEEGVRQAFGSAEPEINYAEVSTANNRLTVTLEDPGQVDAAREAVLPLINGTGLTREWSLEMLDGGQRLVLTPTASGLQTAVTSAMDSATDVVRRRIDALGTREPTIIRQGDDRIVVQVPGLQDPQALKDLLGRTARLEFKLVDDSPDAAALVQQGIAPTGSQLVSGAPGSDYEGAILAVRRLGGVRGDSLTSAKATNDPQTNEPAVSITFDSQGAARFARLTRDNVGKQFAIILDGEVISAPRINEPILGGTSQISGGFTAPQASQLAIALNSGALPVELTVVEERTVGPDLGADSIKAGAVAMLVGTVVLIAFMLVTYGRFGVYTTAALILNALMILGIMAVVGATLTLPGIAGFVLTIGAAVDANVLINERIREERARGRRVVQAVEAGYREASRAIFDANITNVIAAVLMFMIGSGPVKGFAVVLMIGIATSVFTAVWLTRMWVAMWLRRARPTDLAL